MIVVIDYGMGNLRSVAKAIEHVAPHSPSSSPAIPTCAPRRRRVVFPGQGAMPRLDARDSTAATCATRSSRRRATSRSWASASDCRCCSSTARKATPRGWACCRGGCGDSGPWRGGRDAGQRLKVPHMGWNERTRRAAASAVEGHTRRTRFYFVHSYFAAPAQRATHRRVPRPMVSRSPVRWRVSNIFAVQFHPEKSQAAGLRLLANFATWQPADMPRGATEPRSRQHDLPA